MTKRRKRKRKPSPPPAPKRHYTTKPGPRPRSTQGPMVAVHATFKPENVEKMDRLRGEMKRAHWLDRMIEEMVE